MAGYNGLYNRYIKRAIGFLLAVPMTLIALPAFLIISASIVLDDGFPVFTVPCAVDIRASRSLLGSLGRSECTKSGA